MNNSHKSHHKRTFEDRNDLFTVKNIANNHINH